ncbi:MAG: cysteine desulfurase [Polyangiaceae bacterium]|nr:cysteine desulfurase [Polyangiaceae bacterium]
MTAPTTSPRVPSRMSPLLDAQIEALRGEFPALHQTVHGQPLVYLDSAATALKPQSVIDAVTQVYAKDCGNIHRAVHLLSARATDAFEGARTKVRKFLGAQADAEIIFVRGTTEGMNLVASSWARNQLQAGDEILITGLEHHSNIVPWQLVAQQTGAKLKVVPVSDSGEVTLEAFQAELSAKTRLVSVAHVSNTLGTVLPVKRITELAHQAGALVAIDGAQAVAHLPVDVKDIDCDFYAFSAHKLYGPTGTGVLYGKRALLEQMPPYQSGGDMIRSVTFEKTTFNELPWKFEAGTADIAGVVGLGAAIDFMGRFDFEELATRDRALVQYGSELLSSLPGVRLIGTAKEKVSVISFVIEGIHPHDIGTIADSVGVAIRTGHHCTQPLMDRFNLPATARASLGIYSRREDLDALGRAIKKAQEMFHG